jgi:hypothetical protein
MGRAVWRVCRLVLEFEKKKFLAKLSVRQADPAWQAWVVCEDAAGPDLMELGVGHDEERAELIRQKPENAK